MKFILRHYEKILLIIFLLIFLIALIWLLNVARESKKHRDSGIELKLKPGADYLEINSKNYDYRNIFYRISDWSMSSKRGNKLESGKQLEVYTDFMTPFEIARSTSPKNEGKLIPYEYFKIGFDPITNEKLIIPNYYDYSVDNDNDLIPDVLEEEIGMHVNGIQSHSIEGDIDNDSFSNIYEYSSNTKMNNPTSHPAFISRVILKGILKNKLPIIFRKVIEPSEDKKDWTIQTNIDEGKQTRKTLFLKIGSTLEYGILRFKILDIIKTESEDFNPGINKFEKKAKIEIKYERTNGDIQKSELNKPIYTGDIYAVIYDLYDGKTYNLMVGDSISLGNIKTGIETYKLAELNLKAKGDSEDCAVFDRDGKQFLVYLTSKYKKPVVK